jgi:uncharacterized membrane protein YccC
MGMATVRTPKPTPKLSREDLAYTVELMLATLLSYFTITRAVRPFVSRPDQLLGGMWAVVAAVFVFRDPQGANLAAAVSRLWATGVSFALCFAYLLLLPSDVWGLVALIGVGALIMMALGRRDDVVTTGITTTVVMVVATIDPVHAWHQPILRLIDTVVGIAAALVCSRVGAALMRRPSMRSRHT